MWFYAGVVAGGAAAVLYFVGDVPFTNAWTSGSIIGGIAALGQYVLIAPRWAQLQHDLEADTKQLGRDREYLKQDRGLWEREKALELEKMKKEAEKDCAGVRAQNREFFAEIERLKARLETPPPSKDEVSE